MRPQSEPLQPCRMIELTSDYRETHRQTTTRIDDAIFERAPRLSEPERERISSEMVTWAPATQAPDRVRSLAPASRVSLEYVELARELDPRLTLLAAPDSVQAKAFRMLRHRLLKHSDPRLIAVTSAERGEGKTTCAANLALALAEETLTRVLLFEANVRQPAVARLFGFEPSECLSLQMARLQSQNRGYVVAAIAGTRLCVAAMSPDLAPGSRLDRFLLGVALSELRSDYDYIVVDTSPALESADPNSVTECVDGVIVVARANKSRRKSVRRVIDQLGSVPLLGIALLDSREVA